LNFHAAFDAFASAKREAEAGVEGAVAAIIADVKKRGDAAVIEYTERFDGIALAPATLRIPPADIAAAAARAPQAAVAALKTAASRIADYHRRLLPAGLDYTDAAGIRLGARWTPLDSVGLYVPGGKAAYPSSVLMNAIPAKVAGVGRLAMVVPTPNGFVNDLVLAAAAIAGVDEIYRIGGAQAVAALAYGTKLVPKVDKIVGPGNAYVAAAKKQVFGAVGIDLIAGPSEILVVADAASDPDWIAADLLSQAEHDEAAQAVLITDSAVFADKAAAAVEALLAKLPRASIARQSWQRHGAIIVVAKLDDAPALIDRLAPEHLALSVEEPERLTERVRHAGAIFLGRLAPEAIGDYVAGPNHVLPTSQSARFSSGLSPLDFMKRTSLIGCGPEGLAAIGPAAATLARAEGLDAHALSVEIRLKAR
jgi:histidinol dehydrogenase